MKIKRMMTLAVALAPLDLPALALSDDELRLCLPPSGEAEVMEGMRDYGYGNIAILGDDWRAGEEGVYASQPTEWEWNANTLEASFSLRGDADLVLVTGAGLAVGTELTSVTLNLDGVSGILPFYGLYLGVVDGDGALLASWSGGFLSGQRAITLEHFGTEGENYLVWGENYRILVGVVKMALPGEWYTTSFSGLSLSAQTLVPEPTMTTLSLLALAGLAARRRRK